MYHHAWRDFLLFGKENLSSVIYVFGLDIWELGS